MNNCLQIQTCLTTKCNRIHIHMIFRCEVLTLQSSSQNRRDPCLKSPVVEINQTEPVLYQHSHNKACWPRVMVLLFKRRNKCSSHRYLNVLMLNTRCSSRILNVSLSMPSFRRNTVRVSSMLN